MPKPRRRSNLWVLFLMGIALGAGPALAAVSVTMTLYPTAPAAGRPVTVTLTIINTGSSQASLDLCALWKKAGSSDAVTNNVHEISLSPGQRTVVQDTVVFPDPGAYNVIVYDQMEGDGDPIMTASAQVISPPHLSSSEAASSIHGLLSFVPASPVSAVMGPGVADERSLITLTAVLENRHATKSLAPTGFTMRVYGSGTTNTVAMQSFSLSEIMPGASQTVSMAFKINGPAGSYQVERYLSGFGPPVFLGPVFTIQTIASGGVRLSNPSVTPSSGTPLTNQYTFEVTVTMADETGLSGVKVACTALPNQIFSMMRVDSNPFPQGTRYRYVHYGALPMGTYHFYCFVYKNGLEAAATGMCNGPEVADPTPPVVANGGQILPDITIKDSDRITLSGTASDPETGLAAVEWRVGGGAWQATTGQANWSLVLNAAVGDQGYATKTVEVRAKNGLGTYTAATQYWRQKVVFERRHPKVAEIFVTGSGQGWAELNPVKPTKPPNKGGPILGQPYFIALKVTNPNPAESYNLCVRWQEKSMQVRPTRPPWDLGMTSPAPTSGDPILFTIGPNETKWVWTTWSHRWNWLEEPDPFEFFVDLGLMWFPMDEISLLLDANSCAQWVQTQGAAVRSTEWTTQAHPDMSPMLSAGLAAEVVEISVPQEKKELLLVSFASALCGMVGSAVASAAGWTVAVGIVGAVYEIACIAASHAAYYAAWDPDTDFKTPVKVEPIDVPELDAIEDAALKQKAAGAVRLTENMRAMHASYARYLGAVEARDKESARMQAQNAAAFARAAAKESAIVGPWAQGQVETLAKLDAGAREKIEQEFRSGLPEAEKDLMTQRFGFKAAEVSAWTKIHATAMPALLKNTGNMAKALGKLSAGLNNLVKRFDQLAQALR